MYRVLVLVAALLAACSGGSVVPGGDGASAGGGVAPDAVEGSCEGQMADLLAALEEIDGRLDVGLVFNDYSERVGDASVAYNRINFDEAEPNCREQVGVVLEDAMNAYIRAQNQWNDCIQDTDCNTDSITPSLQTEWSKASGLIDKAGEALNE